MEAQGHTLRLFLPFLLSPSPAAPLRWGPYAAPRRMRRAAEPNVRGAEAPGEFALLRYSPAEVGAGGEKRIRVYHTQAVTAGRIRARARQ